MISKSLESGKTLEINKCTFESGKYCDFISFRILGKTNDILDSCTVKKKELLDLMEIKNNV